MGGEVWVMCQRDGCRYRYRTTYLEWKMRTCSCPRCQGWEARVLEEEAA